MQNADKSSSGRTRLLKGSVAVQRNSQDILASPTPYSYKGTGSRIAVAIGGSSECCTSANANTTIPAPTITHIMPGDGFLDVFFDPTRSLTYWTVSTTSSVPGEVVPDVSGTASPIRVSGLVNRQAYTLRLSKTTPTGISGLSAPVTNARPLPVPGQLSLAIDAGNQSLTVTVTAPTSSGGSAIIRYEQSLDNQSTWVPVTFSSGMAFTMTGLTNGVTKTVYVRAVNDDGPGPAASAVGTPATVPSVPMLAIANGNQTLVITVTAGDDGGSPIRNFVLSYTVGGVLYSQTITYNQVPVTYTIPSLVNGTAYTISATAVNDIGTSSSATATGTPATVPGLPGLTVVAGDQTLTVTVSAPVSNGGSAIIRYEQSLDNSTWSTANLSGSNAITVTGMVNDVVSTVYVRAVNSMGAGAAASIDGTPTAAPPVPLAPVLTGMSAKTLTTVTLTFTQEANGIAITNYKYSLNGGAFTAFSPVDTTSPVTISGLTAATTYAIRLKAVSASGDSAESNEITVTTYAELRVERFTEPGTYTWVAPANIDEVEYLVVGGGGGGGGTVSNIRVLGNIPFAASDPSPGTLGTYYIWDRSGASQHGYLRRDNANNNDVMYIQCTAPSLITPNTGGTIFDRGKWYPTQYVYLMSTVAPTVTNTTYSQPQGFPNIAYGNNVSAGSGGGGGGSIKTSIISPFPKKTVTPNTSYTVVVGAGGAGGTATPSSGTGIGLGGGTETNGADGEASSFDDIIAAGGAGGKASRSGFNQNGGGGLSGDSIMGGRGGAGGARNAASNTNPETYQWNTTILRGTTAGSGVSLTFDNTNAVTYGSGGDGGDPNTVATSTVIANTGKGGEGTGATLNDAASGRDGASGVVMLRYYI